MRHSPERTSRCARERVSLGGSARTTTTPCAAPRNRPQTYPSQREQHRNRKERARDQLRVGHRHQARAQAHRQRDDANHQRRGAVAVRRQLVPVFVFALVVHSTGDRERAQSEPVQKKHRDNEGAGFKRTNERTARARERASTLDGTHISRPNRPMKNLSRPRMQSLQVIVSEARKQTTGKEERSARDGWLEWVVSKCKQNSFRKLSTSACDSTTDFVTIL